MAMHRFAAILVAALQIGSALAESQVESTRPVPPAPDVECHDCFGLAAKKPVQVFSYEPLLAGKPYGEENCGELHSLDSNPETERALMQYGPFWELASGTFRRGVAFKGTSEDAIGCMILLARVKERRLADGLLEPKDSALPTLYGWKSLFLRFDPRSGHKLIWIPVRPTAEEQVDLRSYLHRSAQTIVGSLRTPLEDLHANDVHFTVGYQQEWVTASVSKDGLGLAVTISPGMGMGQSSRLRTGIGIEVPAEPGPMQVPAKRR